MNPEDMKVGHYYWFKHSNELYLCTHRVSKEENGYGSVKLRRVSGTPHVSGGWYSFKIWNNNAFREHNP